MEETWAPNPTKFAFCAVNAKKNHEPSLDRGEELLSRTLLRLAAVLVRLGLSSPKAEQMLRRAFVLTAAEESATGTRAPTQSQIASIAGISRLDVRKILDAKAGSVPRLARSLSRVELILRAWRTDLRFLDKSRQPKPLGYRGKQSDFAHLVREYGRDVTVKTIRDQLLKTGAAKESNGRLFIQQTRRRQTPDALAAKTDLRFINSSLDHLHLGLGRRAYTTKRAVFTVQNKKIAKRLQREAQEKIQLLFGALHATAPVSKTRPSASSRAPHRVTVSATITTESGGSAND